MNKILITGHRGYIGSRLLKRIPDAMTLDGNILLATLPDADIIYHLAAYASVPDSWDRPVDYMENLRTTVRLVKAYPKAKIIHAGTCAAMNPESSPYAFAKRASADYLKTFHRNWVNVVFPNIFGDSPRSVVDLFREQESLKIYGDGLTLREYVHVDDIVEGLVQSMNWDTGEYTLGTGKSITVLEIAQATGKPYEHIEAAKEQKDASMGNTTPSWSPTIDVLEYVKT